MLYLAWLAKKSVEATLRELKAAGLDSLTGGGAEIFRKEVRSAIARGKESAEERLDVHRTWWGRRRAQSRNGSCVGCEPTSRPGREPILEANAHKFLFLNRDRYRRSAEISP